MEVKHIWATDLFIDPHTCSAVSGSQPANQHRDGCLHSSDFSTGKLTVCQITIVAYYLVVSEIPDTLVYIFGRLDPSCKENKVTLYNWPLKYRILRPHSILRPLFPESRVAMPCMLMCRDRLGLHAAEFQA